MPADHVATVIACCQAMCTFSLLESFSNNFVEAWKMEVPLIVTDADWSREACGAAALYVDPRNAPETVRELATVVAANSCRLHELVENGRRQLELYPDSHAKTAAMLQRWNVCGLWAPVPIGRERIFNGFNVRGDWR